MNDDQGQLATEAETLHACQVEAIAKAVFELLPTFSPKGFTPEAVIEGAVKGAAMIMIAACNSTVYDVADCLDGFSAGFRNVVEPKRGKLHVVE